MIGLSQVLGLPGESPRLVAVATLAGAALFNPLRRRVQTAVDRRFNRSRYDAARVFDALAAGRRQELDLGDLTDDLGSVVRATLEPDGLSLWLRGPG